MLSLRLSIPCMQLENHATLILICYFFHRWKPLSVSLMNLKDFQCRQNFFYEKPLRKFGRRNTERKDQKMAEDAETKRSTMTIDFVLASTYETMFIPRKISRQGHQNSQILEPNMVFTWLATSKHCRKRDVETNGP